ncbi:DUF2267 domain-containing protein [Streptomyces odontomachi]|uniref:DUF2267 domain-containing protein n=1 Tax=Streptomyces odontomachi TaxID=2944940 RepID=UPI00210EECD1|nr:DUF2267 domain-containing protein [Streptomyces sp. ODS25]
MKYQAFMARVRDRGEYADRKEAAQATEAVLRVLGERLTPHEADDLASQLPGRLGEVLQGARGDTHEAFGVTEFQRRVTERAAPVRARGGAQDAHAVLSTVGEAVSGGELNQLISQLPSGYAALFGKPELT